MVVNEIKGAVILLLFALLTAFGFNYLSPNGIAVFGQWDTKSGVISANGKHNLVDNGIEINSTSVVRHLVETGQRVLLDVRSMEEYSQGHIPQALSFPLDEFDQNLPVLTARFKPGDPLLVYCSSVECDSAHTFAHNLKGLGFKNIKVFSGGLRQWEEEGHKVVRHDG